MVSNYILDLVNQEKCTLEIKDWGSTSIICAISQELNDIAHIKVEYSKLGQAIDNWRKANGDLTYAELENIRESIEDELEETQEKYKDLEKDFEELKERYKNLKRL
ncbi:MAG: hypothetical protein ACLTK6_16200 [Clostridium perfringens]